MATKYPIVLVHGIAAKQLRILNAFGKIGNKLEEAGNAVFIADTDGFGRIETNAEQLRDYIERVLSETGAEKVNIIAHSKGGLDSKYMITELGMEDKVASLTTLCTPHKGSIIASWIWDLPRFMKKTLAFFIDNFYKLFLGDKKPDSLGACEELRRVDESEDTLVFSEKVYCQSYSSNLKRGRDCFVMALPMMIYKHFESTDNDGLVSVESAKFGNYRGECLDISVSHVQIIDLFSKKSQKEKIYSFYISLAEELEEMGY
ncbi:MAG: alpha/beta fold hydrolase [Clostridia bacterium]|nr:alpha/beta fold hydrolase [Clostridia bacterium]